MRPLGIFILLGLALLSLGTVIKKKDAVRLTQTDPIGYQEKLKEEAEGKKGPPVPSLRLFPKERFLVEGPIGKMKGPASLEEKEDWEFWLEEGPEEETGFEGEEDEFKLGTGRDDITEESLDFEAWWKEEEGLP